MKNDKKDYKGMDKMPFLLQMSKEADRWDLSDYLMEANIDETTRVIKLSSVMMKLMREYCSNNEEYGGLTTVEFIQAMKMVAGKLLQSQAILQEQDVENREGLQ